MKKPKLLVGTIGTEVNEIKNIVKKGMYVFVANHHTRFWVHIAEIIDTRVIGIICSHISNMSYGFGDCIQFSVQNIFDIFTLVEDQTNANIQKNHQALVCE